MKNIKLLKGCLGVVALSLGLSACMETQRSEQVDNQYYEKMNTQNKQTTVKKTKAVQKTYATKDPSQQEKATPGPARKAAPQIPVIQ